MVNIDERLAKLESDRTVMKVGGQVAHGEQRLRFLKGVIVMKWSNEAN